MPMIRIRESHTVANKITSSGALFCVANFQGFQSVKSKTLPVNQDVPASLPTWPVNGHLRLGEPPAEGAGQVCHRPLHVLEVLHLRLFARHAGRPRGVLLHPGRLHLPATGERK